MFITRQLLNNDMWNKLVKKSRANVNIVSNDWLTSKCNTKKHQGVASYSVLENIFSESELVKDLKKLKKIVILDEIHDPFNLGATIRNCVALGYDAIILKKNRQVGMTPIVEKASAGSISKINIYFVTNLSQTILKLKERDYYIIGSCLDNDATNIYDINEMQEKIIVIFGNEKLGVHKNILLKCDLKVYYPIKNVQSLNISSSVGMILGYFNILSNNKS